MYLRDSKAPPAWMSWRGAWNVEIKCELLSSGKIWWRLVELRFIVVVAMNKDVA